MFLQEVSFDEDDITKDLFVDYAFRSDILDPEGLTSNLGITPSRAYAKGEKYQGRVLNVNTGEVENTWNERWTGIWAISTKGLVASKKVEDHVQYLLNILESKKETITRYLADSDNYQISFYIWWEPFSGYGSYQITQVILKRMSNLCHYVDFGVLCTEDEK